MVMDYFRAEYSCNNWLDCRCAGASVVGATLGLGAIYVVLCFISVILQIIITVSIGILLFAHKKIGLVLIFALAAMGFIVSMVTYAIAAQLVPVILSKQLFQLFLCRLLHIYWQRTTLQMAQ